ncbi:uncharacterized protein [Drosophila virilis]|uniref:uncharacterized protein n=1 Tax=Drosophila virilis TaxID=7244 RepID=UPI0013962403|nr:uncharacterized protein LOC26530582 [Drosophila virilis]
MFSRMFHTCTFITKGSNSENISFPLLTAMAVITNESPTNWCCRSTGGSLDMQVLMRAIAFYIVKSISDHIISMCMRDVRERGKKLSRKHQRAVEHQIQIRQRQRRGRKRGPTAME